MTTASAVTPSPVHVPKCNGRTMEELRALLASPFPEESIDWKPQTAGWKGEGDKAKPWVKVLAYIDNRAMQDRLDDVCGVGGWRNEFRPMNDGMLCGLSILIDGEWVTKWDGAPQTEIEAVKGGLSNAMKRAGVQWGIGRYLYHVDVTFGRIADNNDWSAKEVKPKTGKPFRWYPPRLPAWAQFDGSGKPGVTSTIQQARGDAAVAALKDPPAGEAILPGTTRNFEGHGGKRIKDVPTLPLQRAMEKLREIKSEQYTKLIEQIGEVLADRASEGA